MITPRMNGSSTALAQITNASSKTALTARNTTRGRVQPPRRTARRGRIQNGRAWHVTTKLPHNVDVPATQAIATRLASRLAHKTKRARVGDSRRPPRLARFTESRARSRSGDARTHLPTTQFESLSSEAGGGWLAPAFNPASLSLNTSPSVAPLPVDSRLST